jgi:hypothetical protein
MIRCIASFDLNATAHSRKATFVVFDDSSQSHAAQLRQLARQSTIRGTVTYVGRREKQALSSEIGHRCGATAGSVNYALFGLANTAGGSGANRNAILLHHAGRRVISVDDDTVCQPYRLKRDVENPASRRGYSDPTEIACFAGMEDAVSACEPVSVDFLSAHSAILGGSTPTGAEEAAAGAAPRTGRIGAAQGIVQCTYNGMIGDSGLRSDLGILLHQNPSTQRNLAALPPDRLEKSLMSRIIVRQAPKMEFAETGGFGTGMFLGMNNAGLLPPSVPNFRSSDCIFAITVAKLYGEGCFAHLPFALLHLPIASRSHSPDRDVRLRVPDFVMAFTERLRPAGETCEERLRSLGSSFMAAGDYAGQKSSTLLEDLAVQRLAGMVRASQAVMQSNTSNGPVLRYLEERVNRCKMALGNADYLLPVDLPGELDCVAALQSVFRDYGRLLDRWPKIVTAARDMNERGRKHAMEIS